MSYLAFYSTKPIVETTFRKVLSITPSVAGFDNLHIEFTERSGSFKYDYQLCNLALTEWSSRKEIEFLKLISNEADAELLTCEETSDPYLYIYMKPGTEAVLVGIDPEAENERDEIAMDVPFAQGWGMFALEAELTIGQQHELQKRFLDWNQAMVLGSVEPSLISPDFSQQTMFPSLQSFGFFFMLRSTEGCPWFSKAERSSISEEVLVELGNRYHLRVCLFPANGWVIENIPGGSDSQDHCMLIENGGAQKLIYKERRKNW